MAVALAVVNHINVAVISHITDVAVVRTWSHIALLLLFSGLGVT